MWFVDGIRPCVFECSSVVNVRVSVVPLRRASDQALLVPPIVIYSRDGRVLSAGVRGQDRVGTCHRRPVFVRSCVLTIRVRVHHLPCSLGLGGSLLPFYDLERPRVFSVLNCDVHRSPCVCFGYLVFVGDPKRDGFFPIFVKGVHSFHPQHVSSVGRPSEIRVVFLAIVTLSKCKGGRGRAWWGGWVLSIRNVVRLVCRRRV